MKKKLFLITLNCLFLLCTQVTVAASSSVAKESQFTEGRHYLSLTEEVKENDIVEDFKKEAANKIQVVEFFSYGCSWCFKLDPEVEEWVDAMPDHVVFERVPVEFNASWRTLTKAYYTAKNFSDFKKLHSALFKAIHTDELSSSSEDVLKGFFVSQGVEAEQFDEFFSSFTVNRKQKWANAISQAYRITAIPTILVQGPKGAYLTSVRMAGSEENLFNVIDYLVKKEHQSLGENT